MKGYSPPPAGSSSVPSCGYQRRDQHYQPTLRGPSATRFTSPEPHAGALPYPQRPSAGLVWAQEATACSRHEVSSGFDPTSALAASGDLLNHWRHGGTSGPIRHGQRQPSQPPRRRANGRLPPARACPTLDGMGNDRQADSNRPRCSFCDKANERVRRMVAGPRGVHICHECVDLCNDIFSQLEPQPPETFRWADLVGQQPALGALAAEKLLKPGVLLVGTARRDASARISGVEPLVMDGELWLSMMTTSTKALGLRDDPRLCINSTVTGPAPGAEVNLRGAARVVHDPEVQERTPPG